MEENTAIDYYKVSPFEKGKLYTMGEYIGRYDGWSNYFGAFMFKGNDEVKYVHPTDTKEIESIKPL